MTYFSHGRPTVKAWQHLLIVYWIVIFAGTHIPRDVQGLDAGTLDKSAHLVAYAILALLVATNWQLTAGHLSSRHLLAVFVLLAAYGLVDESTQLLVDRDGNIRDWLADLIGAAIGLALFPPFRALLLGRPRDQPTQ